MKSFIIHLPSVMYVPRMVFDHVSVIKYDRKCSPAKKEKVVCKGTQLYRVVSLCITEVREILTVARPCYQLKIPPGRWPTKNFLRNFYDVLSSSSRCQTANTKADLARERVDQACFWLRGRLARLGGHAGAENRGRKACRGQEWRPKDAGAAPHLVFRSGPP